MHHPLIETIYWQTIAHSAELITCCIISLKVFCIASKPFSSVLIAGASLMEAASRLLIRNRKMSAYNI